MNLKTKKKMYNVRILFVTSNIVIQYNTMLDAAENVLCFTAINPFLNKNVAHFINV